MKTLALDTSGEVGVLAISVDGQLVAESRSALRARHGETLLPQLADLFAQAKLTAADLDLVAVGLGPGSFTGVRIGVATAKGLALARETPVVGVRTTRVLARAVQAADRAVFVDAAKGEVFMAAFHADARGQLVRQVLDDTHGTPAQMARLVREALGADVEPVAVGTGLSRYADEIRSALMPCVFAPAERSVPSGALLALEAEEVFTKRGPDDPDMLQPLYVRASDATPPKNAHGAAR